MSQFYTERTEYVECFYEPSTKVKVTDMTWTKHQRLNNEYDYGSVGEIVHQFQPDGTFLGYEEPYYFVSFDPSKQPAIITESCLQPVDIEPLYEIKETIITPDGNEAKVIRPVGLYKDEKLYLVEENGVKHMVSIPK
jgi:hypothetical protein